MQTGLITNSAMSVRLFFCACLFVFSGVLTGCGESDKTQTESITEAANDSIEAAREEGIEATASIQEDAAEAIEDIVAESESAVAEVQMESEATVDAIQSEANQAIEQLQQDAEAAQQQLQAAADDAKQQVSAAADFSDKPYAVIDGKISDNAIEGWKTYNGGGCGACHGKGGVGAVGPNLAVSVTEKLSKEEFFDVVTNGRSGTMMRPHNTNTRVMDNLENLYVYLLARGDGVLGPGNLIKSPLGK